MLSKEVSNELDTGNDPAWLSGKHGCTGGNDFVKGKVAIVTGGTSGLGFCVARRLCQGGAKVVLASSTREKGDLAVRLLKEEGFDVIFLQD